MNRWLPFFLFMLVLLCLLGLSYTPISADSASVTPLPPVDDTDGRAGMCYSFYQDGTPGRPYLPWAYDAGSRWDRFDFSWPDLEPENDKWNQAKLGSIDILVDDLSNAGIDMVGILLWTPDWATETITSELPSPGTNGAPLRFAKPQTARVPSLPPAGLELPWNDSDNHWSDFVHYVVSRYGDRVKHWEMWNEPDWSYFWTGTYTDYARLLEVGYRATKDACPDCRVLFGGLHYWADPGYYKRVMSALSADPGAAGNGYFFDVMSVHLYSRPSSVYDEIISIRESMKTYNIGDHPIWLTETGVPVWNDASVDPDPRKYDFAATQKEAASYVIQSYANAWASGVERYFFFRTHDDDMSEYFGLIRNDYSLRPAYAAYQIATRYLVSPTMVTDSKYLSGTRRVTLWGTPWGKLSVFWNTTPETVTFNHTAILPHATLMNRRGVTRTITPTWETSGSLKIPRYYTLTLPGATANRPSNQDDYFIGGEPYLVIEADTAPPTTPTIHLPDAVHSSIPISCTASDDGSGIQGYEIRVQTETAWIDWPGIHSAPISFPASEHDQRYCFQARAWDRAGNYGPWTITPACATSNPSIFLPAIFRNKSRSGTLRPKETP